MNKWGFICQKVFSSSSVDAKKKKWRTLLWPTGFDGTEELSFFFCFNEHIRAQKQTKHVKMALDSQPHDSSLIDHIYVGWMDIFNTK